MAQHLGCRPRRVHCFGFRRKDRLADWRGVRRLKMAHYSWKAIRGLWRAAADLGRELGDRTGRMGEGGAPRLPLTDLMLAWWQECAAVYTTDPTSPHDLIPELNDAINVRRRISHGTRNTLRPRRDAYRFGFTGVEFKSPAEWRIVFWDCTVSRTPGGSAASIMSRSAIAPIPTSAHASRLLIGGTTRKVCHAQIGQ